MPAGWLPDLPGQAVEDEVLAACGHRLVHQRQDRSCAPAMASTGRRGCIPVPGTANYGQIGYTQQTFVAQANNLIPTVSLDNPFPNGLQQPIGNSLGLLTGVGGQYSVREREPAVPTRAGVPLDIQRELPGKTAVSVTYMGTRGDNLSSGSGLNINQLDPKYLDAGAALNAQVPNPFFGIAQAGAFSTSPTIARGQLLRPFPQFGNVLQLQESNGALPL